MKQYHRKSRQFSLKSEVKETNLKSNLETISISKAYIEYVNESITSYAVQTKVSYLFRKRMKNAASCLSQTQRNTLSVRKQDVTCYSFISLKCG